MFTFYSKFEIYEKKNEETFVWNIISEIAFFDLKWPSNLEKWYVCRFDGSILRKKVSNKSFLSFGVELKYVEKYATFHWKKSTWPTWNDLENDHQDQI